MQGEIPADILYEDDHCIVINDIHPQSPVHMLVIPRKPMASLAEAENADQSLLGHLMVVASKMARQRGIENGFRVVANNGKGAGQTIFHLHFHVLGGKAWAESTLTQ